MFVSFILVVSFVIFCISVDHFRLLMIGSLSFSVVIVTLYICRIFHVAYPLQAFFFLGAYTEKLNRQ